MTKLVKAGVVLVPVTVVFLLVFLRRGAPSRHQVDDFSDLRVESKTLPEGKDFKVALDAAVGFLPGSVNAPRWLLVAQALKFKWDADAATNVLFQSEKARACVKVALEQCEGCSKDEPVKTMTGYIGSLCDNFVV